MSGTGESSIIGDHPNQRISRNFQPPELQDDFTALYQEFDELNKMTTMSKFTTGVRVKYRSKKNYVIKKTYLKHIKTSMVI